MAEDETSQPTTVGGRLRKASLSIGDSILNFNPQPGMWAATGTAIAYAPTIAELRAPIAGGDNIAFNDHGHSARTVTTDENGDTVLSTAMTRIRTVEGIIEDPTASDNAQDKENDAPPLERRQTLAQQAESPEKHGWAQTLKHGFNAFYKFSSTPTGFLMTVYGLNIVAWGAMLFFLLLDAAPAMDHPNKDSNDSPRKIWLEIDSQILNALFCVTGFGLAPWRFRDLWWLFQARIQHNKYSMLRLEEQNRAWFRPPKWYEEGDEEHGEGVYRVTFTGEVAPPTKLWKMSFVVWCYVMNTLFQCVLCGFMWGYNRINRPSWATGTFIALGCGVAMLAGIMMWWEGRRVKKIEGPVLKVVTGGPMEVERKTHRLMR